jgi:ABC-type Fe3+-siderophore transport system permease subunit
MSFSGVMGFVNGALQFIVAGYALRLNRVFGTARVGWSLFWAFSLLAALSKNPLSCPSISIHSQYISINPHVSVLGRVEIV